MKAKSIRGHMNLANVYSAPGHLIRRSQQIAVAIFFEEFGAYEVTPVQYAALIAIRDTPGMDQRTLVNRNCERPSTIGTMLKTLEERRLIAWVTPKDNQQIKQLFISKNVDKLLQTTRQHIHRVQERILGPLSATERAHFMDLLSRLVNNKFSRAPLKVAAIPRKDKAKR